MQNTSYLKRLKTDLDRWVASSWIDDALAAKLYQDAEVNGGEERSSQILPGLGALIIILGLLTIIASNWSDLTGVVRLGLFFSLFALVTLGAGELRARAISLPANISGAIAAALAGGGLVIVGQLYHTGATTAAFLSTWTMMALLISILLRTPLGLTLTSALCIFWMLAHFGESNIWRLDDRIIYMPVWSLPVWAIVGVYAAATRMLGLVHLVFIGLAIWVTPTLFDILPFDTKHATLHAFCAAGVWLCVAAVFEVITRLRETWAFRTLAGWSAWIASIYLVIAAGSDRFDTNYLGAFGLPVFSLVAFCALTAYGAAPGRRWLRGAGVAGFIGVSLIFFSVTTNLLVSGVIMVVFGLGLLALLHITNRMLKRARTVQNALGGASS